METALTDLYGIEHPIVLAGMGGVANVELCRAVSSAGGLGSLGLAIAPAPLIGPACAAAGEGGLPYVAGFLVPFLTPRTLEAAIDARPPGVALFWGDVEPFARPVKDAGLRLFVQVGTLEAARRAVDLGADVVVAQGVEAGGHVEGTVSTLVLVPRIVDELDVPVVAAGGVADGRGLAAVLALGAAGAWVGTRFLATREADAHEDYKKAVLGASEEDTVHTTAYGVGWPEAPHRVLRNRTTDGELSDAYVGTTVLPPEVPTEVVEAMGFRRRDDGRVDVPRQHVVPPFSLAGGQVTEMACYAGQSAGLVDDLPSAAEVVAAMAREAEERLRAVLGGGKPTRVGTA